MDTTTNTTEWILADGHVHIHPEFRLDKLFQAAATNFRRVRKRLAFATKPHGFLLLTESAWARQFETILNHYLSQGKHIGSFSVAATEDANCLALTSDTGENLYLVSGKQIVTKERLEVLALGLHDAYPDGKPIREVLDDLAPGQCLRVLPWGAGKWLGKRGTILSDLVANPPSGPLFLGDNGNRPFFWPLPRLFAQADSKAIRNLPGSDPLPFPGQDLRAGSFGFYCHGGIDRNKPFSSLSAVLKDPHTVLNPFGETEKVLPFFRYQLAMQLGKKQPSESR